MKILYEAQKLPEEKAEKTEKIDVSNIEKILLANEEFAMKTLRKICEIDLYETRRDILKTIRKLFQVCVLKIHRIVRKTVLFVRFRKLRLISKYHNQSSPRSNQKSILPK